MQQVEGERGTKGLAERLGQEGQQHGWKDKIASENKPDANYFV